MTSSEERFRLRRFVELLGVLVEAAGSRDGRGVVRALDDLRRAGRPERLPDGRYALAGPG